MRSYHIWVTGAGGILGRLTAKKLTRMGHQVTNIIHKECPDFSADTKDNGTKELIIDFGAELPLWPDFPPIRPDVILHLASAPATAEAVDMAGTQRLIAWLSGTGAKPHIIYISIVGVDKSSYPYYQVKFKVENLLLASGLPVTILRTTQFHHFVEFLLKNLLMAQPGSLQNREISISTTDREPGKPLIMIPKGWQFQPIDVDEVASRLAGLCTLPAGGLLPDFGGPEILTIQDLMSSYTTARKIPIKWVEETMPELGARGDLFASTGHLSPDFKSGILRWQNYLTINSQTFN